MSHILNDEDGIRGDVLDQTKGTQGFIASSPALENLESEGKKNYADLEAQCCYVLAGRVTARAWPSAWSQGSSSRRRQASRAAGSSNQPPNLR